MTARGIIAIAWLCACGGDGVSADNGVVQIADYTLTPVNATCGVNGNGTGDQGAPDSVITQLELVNTTRDTLQVVSAAVYGLFVRASDSTDVGRIVMNQIPVPFSPTPIILRSKDGDRDVRVAFATTPICLLKHIGYDGSADVNVSIRLRLTSGEYATDFKSVHFTWIPN